MTTALAPRRERRANERELRRVLKRIEYQQPPADLQPKQRLAFESEANEKLYGGAAYGGKSYLFRRLAITFAKWVPGIQIYIFRREFGDLYKNHMEGPQGFPAMVADDVAAKRCRVLGGDNQIRFFNPGKADSVIHLCHAQHEKDVYGYQGAEIHILLIDELTQWLRSMYTFLRSRVRLGGLKVPKWLKHRLPMILSGANPGGIGHNWVKADFVSLAPEMTITQMPNSEGGMRRQFIPAKLEDNPIGVENDPEYEHRLEGLSDKQLAKAMRAGNWDIVAGGFFDDVWDRDKHVLKPFPIPRSWIVFRAFDWGSSKPFSVGWWARTDDSEVEIADRTVRSFPRGSLIRIAEWYGWNGTANEGLKMKTADISAGILEREAYLSVRVRPGPADGSIYDTVPGEQSIGDKMLEAGVEWTRADKSPGSRKNGFSIMRDMLAAALEAHPEEPGMWVFENCTDGFIRTVPVLQRDPKNTDDVDTKSEDHTGDESRYAALSLEIGGDYGTSTWDFGSDDE